MARINETIRRFGIILSIFFLTILSGCEDIRFEQEDVNTNHVVETGNDTVGNIWTVHLSPVTVTYKGAGATTDELKVLKKEFPGWTFKNGGSLLGSVKILHYDTFMYPPETPEDTIDGPNGIRCLPDCFELKYSDPGDATSLRWIQIICTDNPMAPGTRCPPENSAYVDPAGNDDTYPFYYTEKEHSDFSDGKNLTFFDRSMRELKSADWRAHLYLAEWDGNDNGIVIIHDGIEWGFKVRKKGCGSPSTYSRAGVARDKWTTEIGHDYIPEDICTNDTIISIPPIVPRYPPGCFECHSHGNYIRGESMSDVVRIIFIGIIMIISIFAIMKIRL